MSQLPDWIHEGLPPFGSAEVWLENGDVRKVRREPAYGQIMFTDCSHPLQNAYCDPESVKAWRLLRDNPATYQQPSIGEYDQLFAGAMRFLGMQP